MRNPGRTRLFRAFNTRPARRLCGRLSNWQVVPVAFILFVSSGAVRADPLGLLLPQRRGSLRARPIR